MEDAMFTHENKDDGNPSEENPQMSEAAEKYLNALMEERNQLPPEFKHSARLIKAEIENIIKTGDGRVKHRFLDLFHNRSSLITSKVGLPIKEFPKFNFVGKLLGPKGNTLKRLQEETKCRMAVLGRGSIRDKEKEESLRLSNDKKFLHLHDDLHVEVTSFAQPAEAHARMAYGLAELRKYIIPDNNDEISEQQARELGYTLRPELEPEPEIYHPPPRRENPPMSEPAYSQPEPPAFRGGLGGVTRGAWRSPRARGRGAPARGQMITRGSHRPSDTPHMVTRGRGIGRGQSRGNFHDNSFRRDENNQNAGYDNGGGYQAGLGNDNYNNDGGEFQRRNNFGQESGRGQWKQRGGVSRFGERSAPYSRRS